MGSAAPNLHFFPIKGKWPKPNDGSAQFASYLQRTTKETFKPMWGKKISFISTLLLGSAVCWLVPNYYEHNTRPGIIIASNQWMWPNRTVPYMLMFNDGEFIGVLDRAMKAIEQETCLRFVPCGKRNLTECLLIYGTEEIVCQSTVGRQYPKKSFMLLNLRECKIEGLLQHELLHTLGFQHEHSRPDRDTFIIINWENVRENAAQNFEKYPWSLYPVNAPYDYGSIMHYSEYSFNKYRERRTLTTFKEAARVMGQRVSMSPWDITKVNKLYQCPEKGNVCKDKLSKEGCLNEGLVKLKCTNKKWAKINCMKTCNLCWPYTKASNACKDNSVICPFWARKGLCDKNMWTKLRSKSLISKWCAKSCNSCG